MPHVAEFAVHSGTHFVHRLIQFNELRAVGRIDDMPRLLVNYRNSLSEIYVYGGEFQNTEYAVLTIYCSQFMLIQLPIRAS
jgi:hypothetical protein